MATHSSGLAWKIPRTEEPVGLQSTGPPRVRHNWSSEHAHTNWKWKVLSHVRLFATPWTIQAMKFSRPEYWNGEPFPSPGDLPKSGTEPRSPSLQANSLPAEPQGSHTHSRQILKKCFEIKLKTHCCITCIIDLIVSPIRHVLVKVP